MRSWSFTTLSIAVLLPVLMGASVAPGATSKSRLPTSNGPRPPRIAPHLEAGALQYMEQSGRIQGANECLPVHIAQYAEVGIFYQLCNDEALQADRKGEQLTPAIAIPDELAPRYHFWRRVYSLWSKDQYILHVSEFPEIVLEVADISRIAASVGDKNREKVVRKILDVHRRDYAGLLMELHRLRNNETAWTPAMARVANTMRGIADPNKFSLAAQSLRIQRGQRDFIARGLPMASRYMGVIEDEFRKEGVPVELSRLAFVESSFNLAAESKVGASGVYQLMEQTARQWVRVSEHIDERNEPVKASRVAARVLAQYHRILGSWPLAITAYNHGVNGLRSAIRNAGTDDLAELVRIYHGNNFGFASKNFFSGYCAILATLQDSAKLFPEVQSMPPIAFETVRLAKPTSVSEVRKKHKMTFDEFTALNRDLSRRFVRMDGTLPQGYRVKVNEKPSQQPTGSLKKTGSAK